MYDTWPDIDFRDYEKTSLSLSLRRDRERVIAPPVAAACETVFPGFAMNTRERKNRATMLLRSDNRRTRTGTPSKLVGKRVGLGA